MCHYETCLLEGQKFKFLPCFCSCKEISSYTIFFFFLKNSRLVIYVLYGIKLQNYVPYNAFVWTIVYYLGVVSWIFYSVVLFIVCLCGLLLKVSLTSCTFFSGLVSVGSIFRKKQRICCCWTTKFVEFFQLFLCSRPLTFSIYCVPGLLFESWIGTQDSASFTFAFCQFSRHPCLWTCGCSAD